MNIPIPKDWEKKKDNIPGVMIAEGNQKTQNPYGNIWSQTSFYAGIGYCNMFLNKIKGTYNIQDEERQMWRGQAMACKAQLYHDAGAAFTDRHLLQGYRGFAGQRHQPAATANGSGL